MTSKALGRFVFSSVLLFICGIAAPLCAETTTLAKLVPDDAIIFVSLQFGDALTAGREAENLELLATAHPVVPLSWIGEVQAATGLRPKNIAHAVAWRTPQRQWQVAIEARQPFNVENVIAALTPDDEGKEQDGRRLYFSEKSGHSLMFLSETRVLLGIEHKIDLDRKAEPEAASPILQSAISSADDALLVVYRNAAIAAAYDESGGLPGPPGAEQWSLTMKAVDDLTIGLAGRYESAAAAEAGAEELRKFVAQLRNYVTLAKNRMPVLFKQGEQQYPQGPKLIPQFESAMEATVAELDGMKIATSDQNVSADMTIKTDQPISTAVWLVTLMPRPAK